MTRPFSCVNSFHAKKHLSPLPSLFLIDKDRVRGFIFDSNPIPSLDVTFKREEIKCGRGRISMWDLNIGVQKRWGVVVFIVYMRLREASFPLEHEIGWISPLVWHGFLKKRLRERDFFYFSSSSSSTPSSEREKESRDRWRSATLTIKRYFL